MDFSSPLYPTLMPPQREDNYLKRMALKQTLRKLGKIHFLLIEETHWLYEEDFLKVYLVNKAKALFF